MGMPGQQQTQFRAMHPPNQNPVGGGEGGGGGGGEGGKPQIEFKRAINYVTKIKKTFNDDQDTYKRFLEILNTYQKEHKPTGIEEVLEQVSHLFADHTDLLMEFTYFLPDYVQEQAKEQLEQYRQQVQESHDRRMRQQQQQGQG